MNRLRDVLRERGMTQAELARATGLGEVRIHRLVTGQHRLNESNVLLLATALDVSIDELFRPSPTYVRRAVDTVKKMSPEERGIWLDMGERLVR